MNRAQIFSPIDRLRSSGSSLVLSNNTNDQLVDGSIGDIYIRPKGLGNFRVHSGDSVGGGAAPSTIPGSIHVGTSANQGSATTYIDVNESVVDNGAGGQFLMRFAWTNTGTNFATGVSVSLTHKSPTTRCLTLFDVLSGDGGSTTHRTMTIQHTLAPSTNPISDYFGIGMDSGNSIGSSINPSVTRYNGFALQVPSSARVTSMAAVTMTRGSLAFPTQIIGFYCPTFAGGTRRWAMLAGEPIQLAQDKALIFDGPTMATVQHDTISTVGDTDMTYVSASSVLRTRINGTSIFDVSATAIFPTTNGGPGLGQNGNGWLDLWMKDTSAAFEDRVIFTSSAALTADRTLTMDMNDKDVTLKFNAAATVTLDNWFDQNVKVAGTPQFARLGIGAAADGTVLLNVNDAIAAPTLAGVPPTFTDYYGGNTNALGDPAAWLRIRVAGANYRVPLYT